MFLWTYLDGEGAEFGLSQTFPTREAAEGWMSEAWSGLAERGVEQVELMDQARDERLYRMSLGEE